MLVIHSCYVEFLVLRRVASGTQKGCHCFFSEVQFGTPDTLLTDNKFQFLAQGETTLLEGINSDQNINLAQSFQSYALNLESLLISRPQYNREEKLTISERVFWKWLKESGSVRYRDANTTVEANTDSLGTDKRFVEEYTPTGTYNKVVQQVGDIDVVNTIKSNDNSYTEVYIHIPTNEGSTPHVLFKSVSDSNYYANMTIANNATDPLDIEYLAGRHFNETHPFGLNLKGYFDLDDSSVVVTKTDDINDPYVTGNFFTQTIKNAYYTDNISGEFDVATTEWYKKVEGASTIDYARSTLDGISIDFNLDNYKLASENPSIKAFSQFNDYVGNKDFQFNALLIYYDTFDPNNVDANNNPIDFSRNLYGILFLDKVEQNGLEFEIPYITKYMPDPLNKMDGTSFGYKLNLKLDTSIENVLVERSINNYSTFSLDLFVDVLTEFKQIQVQLNDKLLEMEELKQDVVELKDLLVNTEDQNELKIRIDNIETSITENQAIFNASGTMTRMIENNAEKIDSIINGTSNAEVSYDVDIIRSGDGISLDKKTPNRLKIENINQKYNVATGSFINIFDTNVIPLSKYTNYIRHENNDISITLSRDLEVFIDDTSVSWKKGQVFRLVFEDQMLPDIYDIKIKTDALNTQGAGAYGVSIKLLDDLDFTPSDNRPILNLFALMQQL